MIADGLQLIWTSRVSFFSEFLPFLPHRRAGTHVTYGASAGQPVAGYSAGGTHSAQAGQTSYDTSYPNSAAFAGTKITLCFLLLKDTHKKM